jgi:hypothetical protein
MAKQKTAKSVIYLFGNEQEFGQIITNFFGLNPDVEVHCQFTTSTIRAKKQTIAAMQPEYETVIMSYIVFTNPGEIKIMPEGSPGDEQTGKVKANLKVN